MDRTVFSAWLLGLIEIYAKCAQSVSVIQMHVTSEKGCAFPAPVAEKITRRSKLHCYTECVQNEECIAVNAYCSVEGACECHLLADAAATEDDLQEDTLASYMGPDFGSIIECPDPPARTLFVDSHVDISNRQHVRFLVKGTADANLGISTGPLCTGVCYYTVIGGWNNAASVICLHRQDEVITEDAVSTPNILSRNKYRRFWLSWRATDSGIAVMFGDGWAINEKVLATSEFSIPPSDIKYLAVTTYKLYESTFVFIK